MGAIGDRTRRSEIALLVDLRQVALRIQVVLPQAAPVGDAVRRNAEADLLILLFGASSAERRLAQVSRVALLDESGVLSLTQ